jgi:hypothetical protein
MCEDGRARGVDDVAERGDVVTVVVRLQDRGELAAPDLAENGVALVRARIHDGDLAGDGDEIHVVVHPADGELGDLRRPDGLAPALGSQGS